LDTKKAGVLSLKPRLKIGLRMASKKGATVISRVYGIYIKKGATFLRAFLPFQKGRSSVFVLIAVFLADSVVLPACAFNSCQSEAGGLINQRNEGFYFLV
jgi:hypothetical protein